MSKNWAICIGINDYYNLTPLNYAMQDAVAIKDFFEQEVGFEQVFYFSDKSPKIDTPDGPLHSLPTFANLKRFLRERFSEPFLSMGDNLWFFFAGHGELHGGHDYLMPIDVDPGNVEETALKISDISAYLRNSGADNTVLLLDACRSQGRRSPVGLGTDKQPGMVTIYSCSSRQSSYEIDQLRHGSFTYSLLKGFRLQDEDSCATVQRIDQYLKHQVPLLNKRYQKPIQTPCTEVRPLAKRCLVLLPGRARLEDVESLKVAAYRAETQSKWDFALQLWTRVLADSDADKDAIAAFQRIALSRVKQKSVSHQSEMVGFEVVKVDTKGKVTEEQYKQSVCWQEHLRQDVTLSLIEIPGGRFLMGSLNDQGHDSDHPQHRVTVSSFLVGRYQVTQRQWRVVADFPKIERDLLVSPSHFKDENRPVEQISWDDAIEFCQRLSRHSGRAYRLPSEAEWEYACRAGTTSPFHYGFTLTTDIANYRGTDLEYEGMSFSGSYGEGPQGVFRQTTTKVGLFPANSFGLHDMHGNVWEWCQDTWHDNYEGAPNDSRAWTEGKYAPAGRVMRGGSWGNNPIGCRSANRSGGPRNLKNNYLGFRVVCEPE